MSVADFVSLEAMHLAVGDSTRVHCPACGASDEKSMKISRTESGVSYVCFRGKCGVRGYIGQSPTGVVNRKVKYATVRQFTKETKPLSTSQINFLEKKYGLTEQEIKRNLFSAEVGAPRLVMPLFDASGDKVGYVSKKMAECPGRKSYTFWSKQVPNMHYPRCKIHDGPVVLVEDILSSIKVARYARCRSLVGVHIHDNLIDQLRMETDSIILGLDNDMVDRMVKQASKLRGLFDVKIIVWPKDPKDMEDKDVKSIVEMYTLQTN